MSYKKIILRRDTAANWSSLNPTLSLGELGYETDTNKLKIGNGSSAWNSLAYWNNLTAGALNDLGDVTITDAANGDFLRWNGTAWVNDAVNLATDTVGNYMVDVSAGTGITVSHTPSEGSTATVSVNTTVIAPLASPTFTGTVTVPTPVNGTDAVTKNYADTISAGINWHVAVELATAAALPNSPTYDNGTSGVGATLTAGSNARLLVDGTNATTGDRILVKNQVDATQNGLYVVTAQGSASAVYVLTRASDQDGFNDDVVRGDAVYTASGATNINQGFILYSLGTGTNSKHIIGTDNLNWSQFTGAANIIAGTGITKSGNTLSIGQDVGTGATVTFATVHANLTGAVTGNASTATTLQTARNIAGKSFNGSADISIAPTDLTGVTSTASEINILDGATLSTTELNYVDGVSSPIQTQLDAKAPLASPTFTGSVSVPTPTENSHAATKLYVDGAVSSASITALNDIGDVTITSASSGQFLKWNGTAWINDSIPAINSIDDITGVTITSAANKDFLMFNGTVWVDQPITLGTDTSGNYVSDVTAGTGVTVTHTPGEGSSASISIGQAVGTSSNVTFANITSTGTVSLSGDPSSALHAATKQYVDNVVSNINFHEPVYVATTANLDGTYSNGTSGVGATLTKSTNGAIGTIDGQSVSVGQRILVKSQTDAKQNGIYTVTAVGDGSNPWQLTRATDADNSPSGELKSGDFCFVTNGSTNAGFGFVNSSVASPIVIGTSEVTYSTFNAAQVVVAGTGLSYSGTTLNVGTADSGRIVVNADNIDLATTGVSASTYTSVTVDTYGRVTSGSNPTITLGTNTNGNYMADVSAGTGISVTHTPGEGSTATIALADVSTNAQTASYTLVLSDKNKIVEMNVGSANNLTVPLNSSQAFPVGSQINILQTGSGQTTVVATGGVTINATPGLKLRAQWSYASLIKRAENTWVLVGDISA